MQRERHVCHRKHAALRPPSSTLSLLPWVSVRVRACVYMHACLLPSHACPRSSSTKDSASLPCILTKALSSLSLTMAPYLALPFDE